MNSLFRSLLAIFLIGLLQGCAFLHSFDKNLLEQINEWEANHEYSRALDTIALISKSHSQYDELQLKKIELQKAAERFEKLRLREANAHIQAKDWQAAESTLNLALEKIPDSDELQHRYIEFKNLRAQHLKSLYYQLYINKAEWLVKNKDVQFELSRTIPDDRKTQNALKKHQQETDAVYKQLLVCGIEAVNIDDLELAEQCYLLAEELKPGKHTQNIIADIQKELGRREKRGAPILSDKSRNLLERAKREMQAGKLKKSRNSYLRIASTERSHALVRSFIHELDKRIAEHVKNRIETGRKLYSQGEIVQALAIWNDIKQLDPYNEYLNSHIERAQRVIDKVNQLKEQEKRSVSGKPGSR